MDLFGPSVYEKTQGTGTTRAEAIRSINAYLIFYYNIELSTDESDHYYVTTRCGARLYVYTESSNGAYRASLSEKE